MGMGSWVTWVPCRHRPFLNRENRSCFPEAKREVRWQREGERRSVSVRCGELGSRPLIQKRRGQKWLPGGEPASHRRLLWCSGPRLILASLARRTLYREQWVWDSRTFLVTGCRGRVTLSHIKRLMEQMCVSGGRIEGHSLPWPEGHSEAGLACGPPASVRASPPSEALGTAKPPLPGNTAWDGLLAPLAPRTLDIVPKPPWRNCPCSCQQ